MEKDNTEVDVSLGDITWKYIKLYMTPLSVWGAQVFHRIKLRLFRTGMWSINAQGARLPPATELTRAHSISFGHVMKRNLLGHFPQAVEAVRARRV